MKLALAIAVLALVACGGSANDDLVPTSLQDQLVFREQTIQLEPARRSPTFTMKVPTIWEQDPDLAGPFDDNDFADGTESETQWGDAELRDGHFDLRIVSADRADAFADKMFEGWRKDNHVIDETRTATEHTLVLVNDEDRHFAIRAWHVAGDPRLRVCWVSIGKRYSKAYRAFVKACANVVEKAR